MKKSHFVILAIAIISIFVIYEAKNDFSLLKRIIRKEDALAIKGTTYFVSPYGNDANDGRSEQSAMLTIQRALDMLMPGDGIVLADGEYLQDFVTARSGAEGNLIIIKGSENAVVKGSGKKGRIAEVRHSHVALTGFTIDGLGGGDGSEKGHYRDKLIYVEGSYENRGVTGLKVVGMHLKNAGGECLRMKYFSRKNEVAHTKIKGCGVYDFKFQDGGKNGEGVYIGTAPEQVAEGHNATMDTDASDNNWVHDNVIDTGGNECVDIKEGSSGNKVERNTCTGQLDEDSAGMDSRGNGNIFRHNDVFGNVGAGIRLGGDNHDDGIENTIVNNYLHDNNNGGIKVESTPQGIVCGNRIENNTRGDMVGTYRDDVKNKKDCG